MCILKYLFYFCHSATKIVGFVRVVQLMNDKCMVDRDNGNAYQQFNYRRATFFCTAKWRHYTVLSSYAADLLIL